MGFFDNISFEDVGVGVAESVAAGIDQSVARYQKNKDRLRDITFTSDKASREKFDNEIAANSKLIKEAAAVFGPDGEDAVFSLIKSEGSLEAAHEAAMSIKKIAANQAISPMEYIGLAEGSPTGITVKQLARYTATPLQTTPGPKPEDIATGFMSFIPGAGTRAAESIETGVRADMAAAGFEEVGSREDFLEGLPEAKANTLKTYMLGRLADPKQEMARLMNVQSNLFAQGKKEEADSIKREVHRLNAVIKMSETDNYTPSLRNVTKGNVEGLIADLNGLGGEFNVNGGFILPKVDKAITIEMNRAGNYIEANIDAAISNGTRYAFAVRKADEFIRKNQKFVFKEGDFPGTGEFVAVEGKLYDDVLFAGKSAEDEGLVDKSTTEDAEVGDGSTAGSANQGALETAIGELAGLSDAEREKRKLEIMKLPGGREALEKAGML
tara:strand:- start:138 stop:1457 length:1320 start_codon:yes stop_codon:yes gene_type:complete